ncbi:hypothetical protein MIND_00677600 [Mycena indigotica]|uniref:Aminoglycoside phosphotransferase domain-containing protein n=1 Tax=Mycena indigotica TaxID=2126181 RepID=A0A8H6SLQ3_9AGAR|nr:uncharacterized protein MIND_00677600 [Mycena indigotica]KAF7301132.1 hypothetical protein MIND_00677600 [Mycena indigotica]
MQGNDQTMAPVVRFRWLIPDETQFFGLRFEMDQQPKDQKIFPTLSARYPARPDDIHRGRLYVAPAASLGDGIPTFKRHARARYNGAFLTEVTFGEAIEDPNGSPCVFFEPVVYVSNKKRRLLLPKIDSPSTLAKGGQPLQEAMQKSDSRFHGVIPSAEVGACPTIRTIHGACQAEPLAQLWSALHRCVSANEQELKASLAQIKADGGLSKGELLNNARKLISALCGDYAAEPGLRQAIEGPLRRLTGFSGDDQLFLVCKNQLAGDPTIQALYRIRHLIAGDPNMDETRPVLVLFMAIRAHTIEIGHAYLNTYYVDGKEEERASWQAATHLTYGVGGTLSTDPSDLEVLRTACILTCVGKAVKALAVFRKLIQAPPIAPSVFPIRDMLGGTLQPARLFRETDMRVFHTVWQREGHEDQHVVVKLFETTTYGEAAHRAAAEADLAPNLVFYGDALQESQTGWSVVVMDYVERADHITQAHIKALEALPGRLRQLGIVHGDLRLPNILFAKNDKVVVIDWNWAGTHPHYPWTMNMGLTWPHGAQPGGRILPEHDKQQIDWIVAALQKAYAKMRDGPLELTEAREFVAIELRDVGGSSEDSG